MASPKLQHFSSELRMIADLLDRLEMFGAGAEDTSDLSLNGTLDVYWADVKMGTVLLEDCGQWSYHPEADDPEEAKAE